MDYVLNQKRHWVFESWLELDFKLEEINRMLGCEFTNFSTIGTREERVISHKAERKRQTVPFYVQRTHDLTRQGQAVTASVTDRASQRSEAERCAVWLQRVLRQRLASSVRHHEFQHLKYLYKNYKELGTCILVSKIPFKDPVHPPLHFMNKRTFHLNKMYRNWYLKNSFPKLSEFL